MVFYEWVTSIVVSETNFSPFYEFYEVKSIINQSTSYKNHTNPSCIDLFLTNSPNSFRKATVVETGLSDSNKLIVTIMKPHSRKQTLIFSPMVNTLINSVYQGHVPSPLNAPVTFQIQITLIMNKSIFWGSMFLFFRVFLIKSLIFDNYVMMKELSY